MKNFDIFLPIFLQDVCGNLPKMDGDLEWLISDKPEFYSGINENENNIFRF